MAPPTWLLDALLDYALSPDDVDAASEDADGVGPTLGRHLVREACLRRACATECPTVGETLADSCLQSTQARPERS